MLLISGSSCALALPAKAAKSAAVTEDNRMMKVEGTRAGGYSPFADPENR